MSIQLICHRRLCRLSWRDLSICTRITAALLKKLKLRSLFVRETATVYIQLESAQSSVLFILAFLTMTRSPWRFLVFRYHANATRKRLHVRSSGRRSEPAIQDSDQSRVKMSNGAASSLNLPKEEKPSARSIFTLGTEKECCAAL